MIERVFAHKDRYIPVVLLDCCIVNLVIHQRALRIPVLAIRHVIRMYLIYDIRPTLHAWRYDVPPIEESSDINRMIRVYCADRIIYTIIEFYLLMNIVLVLTIIN
ncbi:hypothetical protein D3C76_1678740 [compost metagenome]